MYDIKTHVFDTILTGMHYCSKILSQMKDLYTNKLVKY